MTGYSAVFSAQADPQRARTVLAGSRQPALNLSFDPGDPQAQLIAERIALDARQVGITVQVSLSGAEDLRLVRATLPSPDPATALVEAARQLGLPQPVFPAAPAATLWTICIKPSAICSMDTRSSRFFIWRWRVRQVRACAAGSRIDCGSGAERGFRSQIFGWLIRGSLIGARKIRDPQTRDPMVRDPMTRGPRRARDELPQEASPACLRRRYCSASPSYRRRCTAPSGARSSRRIRIVRMPSPRSFDRSSSAEGPMSCARSSRLPLAKPCSASLSI